MASFLHSATLMARASRPSTVLLRLSSQPARFAHSSYGNSQSGHPKSDAPNPQVDKEHPGPEAPAEQGRGKSSSFSGSSLDSTANGAQSAPSASTPEESASIKSKDRSTTSGAKPALYNPKDAADIDNPEVKKHNEDMRKRADQTPNQVK